MAYGPINVPGVSQEDLNTMSSRIEAVENAQIAAKSTIDFMPTAWGGGNL